MVVCWRGVSVESCAVVSVYNAPEFFSLLFVLFLWGGAFFHSLDNLKRALYILVLKHLLSWVSRISQLAIGLCDVRQIPKARYRCKHYFAHRWTLACKWPVDVTFRESWSVG